MLQNLMSMECILGYGTDTMDTIMHCIQ